VGLLGDLFVGFIAFSALLILLLIALNRWIVGIVRLSMAIW
jgi:hypothetical protein